MHFFHTHRVISCTPAGSHILNPGIFGNLGAGTLSLLLCLASSSAPAQSTPANLGVSRDIWLSLRNDGLPGTGTATDPFDASGTRFDAKMREVADAVGTNVHIHLMPGIYTTLGYRAWQLRSGAKLEGAGMDVTVLKMVDSVNNTLPAVGASAGGDTHIQVSDLTIDCNYSTQHPNLGNAITLGGSHHSIRRVRAINAAGFGIENFTIVIGAAFGDSEGNLIEDCEVTDFKGTYATAIAFSGPAQVNRYITGVIRGNKVLNLRNSSAPAVLQAYGGGGLKNVLFENNYCFRCDVAVNIDTARSINLTFKGNQFNTRRRGIGLLGQQMDTVVIENNVFEMEPNSTDYAIFCYDIDGKAKLRNFIIRDNIIRSVNGKSGLSGGLGLSVLDGQTWIVSGNRIDPALRSYVYGPGSTCFDNTDFAGRPIKLLGGTDSQVNLPVGQAGTVLLNRGNAYVFVETTGDSAANGANLLTAYARAKSMKPQNQPLSSTNRATVFLLPATYTIADSALNLDTAFVDIIGLGNVEPTKIESSGNALVQTADDVGLENLTLGCHSTAPINFTSVDKAAYFPADNLSKTIVKNCRFTTSNNGLSMRLGVRYSGLYQDCQSGPLSFGAGNFWGTAKNCIAGHQSFGGPGVLTACQIDGAISGSSATTGRLSDCRVGPVPDNSPCIVLGEGASLYNCTLIANPGGNTWSIDAIGQVRARIAHCRFNRGMRNVINSIAQPANVDDPNLD
jgi:hypothetical protein